MRTMPIESLNGYKYRTSIAVSFSLGLPLAVRAKSLPYKGKYIRYDPATDMCTLEVGYCWDGPSGPTFDTPDWMYASLKHDAGYQLMRVSALPPEAREYIDELMYRTCRECGMGKFRASYSLWAVKRFAAGAAKQGTERQRTLIIPIGA